MRTALKAWRSEDGGRLKKVKPFKDNHKLFNLNSLSHQWYCHNNYPLRFIVMIISFNVLS